VKHDIQEIWGHFEIPGTFVSAEPYGTGHINDTYAAVVDEDGQRVRYIHQRINHDVFKDPASLMDNISRVTRHQRRKLARAGVPSPERRALTLVPARDGASHHVDGDGNTWRTYLFIEKARTHDFTETPNQAVAAAKAFGEFQKQLVDLPGDRLHETIPDFHHTPRRFEALEEAIASDACNRARDAVTEIDFALRHKDMTATLIHMQEQGLIPERITHNDSKLNNVMLDDETDEGICVIDLDTVMPGLVLYDFGDMVRTATSPSAEDEKDLSKVHMQMSMFEALVRGYLESAGEFLNSAEKEHLVFSGKLITFEIGVRFLADFLSGDVYFKTHREGHNLERCRTQFKLVQSIVDQEEAMQRVVESI